MQGAAAASRRSITNTAPPPPTHPSQGSRPARGGTRSQDARVHYTVLKQQPTHPTHWWCVPHGTTTTGRMPGTQKHHTPTPPQGEARGLLPQDPIVRHGPHPHRRIPPFHHPTGPPKGTRTKQVLKKNPDRHTRYGHLLADIPPLSSPHRHHARAPKQGRPPHGGQRLLRKEVIQPHLPVRLPCYDLVPIAGPTFDGSLPPGVRPPASGVTNFRDLTGGVYKARERIHRSVADLRLLATPTS